VGGGALRARYCRTARGRRDVAARARGREGVAPKQHELVLHFRPRSPPISPPPASGARGAIHGAAPGAAGRVVGGGVAWRRPLYFSARRRRRRPHAR
jgi:hypothetical protein